MWGGERIFAAGADIKAMAEWGPDEVRPSVDALGAACDLLEEIPKISIAAVNGFALGGGLELALGADLRFLADDATVGQPEITLGVIPGAGGTQRLTHLIGPGGARDLVYSGRLVRADEARRLGIADRVVPAAEVLPTAVEAARAFATRPAAGARGRQGRDRGRARRRPVPRASRGNGGSSWSCSAPPTSARACGRSWTSATPLRLLTGLHRFPTAWLRNLCSHTPFISWNEPMPLAVRRTCKAGPTPPSRPPVPSERM